MKMYVFAGQGAQFEGMGKDMYENSDLAKSLFEKANDILNFRISDIMFEGSADQLKETKITQPAMYLHAIIKAYMAGDSFIPDAVAGHSLGEMTALVAAKVLSFEDGLKLVNIRATAVQRACELNHGTMAAILGAEDSVVQEVCSNIDDIVVPANYNCPGQLVISGTLAGVEKAVAELQSKGFKAIILAVGGAFHSPLMQPALDELAKAVETTHFNMPICPIYQNVHALPVTNPDLIKKNIVDQLTAPVLWGQTIKNALNDGITEFVELGGTGKVLQGMIKKVDRKIPTSNL
jgi:[acyl-carrier-protein] S-malonyltransferase